MRLIRRLWTKRGIGLQGGLSVYIVGTQFQYFFDITYGPRKAVAEVSNHNEPIGRGCVALVRKSIDVRLTRVADQVACLRTDFDCHLIRGLLVHRSFRFK